MSGLTLVLLLAVVLTGFAAWRLAAVWLRYRGRMVITCPENQKPAGVSVDAGHAAASAFGKTPDLRLADCSRWPERATCGQECLGQIEAAPEDCLVRNRLIRWYEGKSCAWCGLPIGEIHVGERKPALLIAGQKSVEWSEIQAEQLADTLATAQPMCFGCHIANTLCREHPELVIERGWPAGNQGSRVSRAS